MMSARGRPNLVAAIVLLISGCASGSGAVATTDVENTSGVDASVPTPSSNSTSPATTTSAPMPERVLGLITPTGVPVGVLEETAAGYLVTTPCGLEVEITEGRPLGMTTVVLDPGHGGPSDTGAVGQNGLPEKEVNLAVAEKAARVLETQGIDVALTRTDDYTIPLFVRARFADTLEAKVMVSIHHNAPTPAPSSEPGIEIFIQSGSEASARLGGLLWEHTREGLGGFEVPWVSAEDAGVMTVLNTNGDDAYGIVRQPETPTALVELGYISNPAEAELHATTAYPPVAGRAVAAAIAEYLSTDNEGSGFVESRVFNPEPGIGQRSCLDPDLG